MRIVVVRLKYISNFTDFDPFFCEPDVQLLYSTSPSDIENAHMVIVPGSKNTVKDLLFLKEKGILGTPTYIFRDGTYRMGLLDENALLKALSSTGSF